MTQQAFDEPKCRQTGRPFEVYEQQISEHEVGAYCSECGEELEVYSA